MLLMMAMVVMVTVVIVMLMVLYKAVVLLVGKGTASPKTVPVYEEIAAR